MISLPAGTKVYLAAKPVSMRLGFDGLCALAQSVFSADPFCGHFFLFRSKTGTYFKALYWDGSGLCLFAKRIEKGRFVWPPHQDGGQILTPGQLATLIEGMDWRRTIAPPAPRRPEHLRHETPK
jgi:transposase